MLSLGIELGALSRDRIRCSPQGSNWVLSLGIELGALPWDWIDYRKSTCGSARAQIFVETTTFVFCALHLMFTGISCGNNFDTFMIWWHHTLEKQKMQYDVKPSKGNASFWKK